MPKYYKDKQGNKHVITDAQSIGVDDDVEVSGSNTASPTEDLVTEEEAEAIVAEAVTGLADRVEDAGVVLPPPPVPPTPQPTTPQAGESLNTAVVISGTGEQTHSSRWYPLTPTNGHPSLTFAVPQFPFRGKWFRLTPTKDGICKFRSTGTTAVGAPGAGTPESPNPGTRTFMTLWKQEFGDNALKPWMNSLGTWGANFEKEIQLQGNYHYFILLCHDENNVYTDNYKFSWEIQ